MVSKKQQENEAKISQAIQKLQQVADSNITPRNIRKIVKNCVLQLQDTKYSFGVRAANAIGTMDEVFQDPNMPPSSRVAIWSAVTLLETVRD